MKTPWQWLIERFDSPDQVKQSAYAFLPAALEVQETPPSPIGRAIIWTIVILFIVAIIWGVVGKMDVVAVAQGQIIPSDRVKTIQPLEIGKIKAIHVSEGQHVKEGDLLITLDSTYTQADADQIQQQLFQVGQEVRRQQAFNQILNEEVASASVTPANTSAQEPKIEMDSRLRGYNSDSTPVIPAQAGIQKFNPALAEQLSTEQYLLFVEQVREYQYNQETLENQLLQKQAELLRTQASLTKLERTLPIVTERTQSLEKLMGKHLVARDQYLELEQERIEKEQDLLALQAQDKELQAVISSIQSQLNPQQAEMRKDNLAKLNDRLHKTTSLEQELIKANERNQQQLITSPIDGNVQQLAVHTIGGVVTPAQELMLIVPEQSALEVEAMILNQDIGFVEQGQTAEVKIDTFNFTKYGMIDARLTQISNDAVRDENLGLVSLARVLLGKSQMQIDNKLVNLSPGMSVTVEFKTGQRRIIEYFLSPLLRYKQESIRER